MKIECGCHCIKCKSTDLESNRIGKIEKPGIAKSTKHCGTEENAKIEGAILKERYLNKKFEVVKPGVPTSV